MLKQKEIASYIARKAALKDETVTRRKVADYKSKHAILTLNHFRHRLRVLGREG